jgi:hypothetical protein
MDLGEPLNRSFSLTGLLVLAICYTLYFAIDFVLPVALELLMSLLLLPFVGFLRGDPSLELQFERPMAGA